MKHFNTITTMAMLGIAFLILAGCESNSPKLGPTISGPDLNGQWSVTEQVDPRLCGEQPYDDFYAITVIHEDTVLTVLSNGAEFDGSVQNERVVWSGDYDEDGATMSVTVDLQILDGGRRLQGRANWKRTDDQGSCSGSSRVVALRN